MKLGWVILSQGMDGNDEGRVESRRKGGVLKIGGASRDRTDDLIVANDALSQLSYSPIVKTVCSIILTFTGGAQLLTFDITSIIAV